MIQIGRVCVKIAGRDAGKKCVVVDILDNKFVLIDGETRRRKCNVFHLEPLNQVIDIKKNASHNEVAKAIEQLGLKARTTKPKEKKEKPKQKRKTPDQIKAQKEEKKKLRDLFRTKKKEEKKEPKQASSLEEKAGIEGKELEVAPHHELAKAPERKEVMVKKKSAGKVAGKESSAQGAGKPQKQSKPIDKE